MTCQKHTTCLVYHIDGKCPDYNQNAECTCQKISPPNQPIPSWEWIYDRIVAERKKHEITQTDWIKIAAHKLAAEFEARLTTAHTEWREEAKREIEGKEREIDEIACDYADHLNKDTILNLHFLQPPKDTV